MDVARTLRWVIRRVPRRRREDAAGRVPGDAALPAPRRGRRSASWRRSASALVSVLLMATAAAIALSVTDSGSQDSTTATTHARTVLQSVLGSLSDQYLQFMAKALDDSTSQPWALTPNNPQDLTRLRALVDASPFVNEGAAVVNLAGIPLTRYTRGSWPSPTDPGLASVRAGLLAGQPGLSGVLTSTAQPSMALAVPIMHGGKPVALLLGLTDLASSQLQQYVAQLHIGAGAQSFVIDGRGLAVAASNPALLGHRVPGLPTLTAATGTHATTYTAGGRREYASYTRLQWGGWATVNAQPTSTLYGPVRSDWFRTELIIFVILTAGAAWLARLNHQRVAALRDRAESALLDPLTHLPNRAAFQHRLDQLSTPGRGGPASSPPRFGVLFLDLDRFKQVNDTHGHLVGDQLLIAVGRRLAGAVRESDFLARLSGDEFGVLMPNTADIAQAQALADRLLAVLSEPFQPAPQITVSIGASIGLALADGRADADDALRDADLAMYSAKESGGRGCHVFEATMATASRRRLELEQELRAAIPAGQLRLDYQLVHDLATGTPVGAEALVRWQHPREGLLTPGAFLDVAADSDLLCAVGSWVRTQALDQLACWRRDVPAAAGLRLSLNVSPRELRRGARYVAEVMDSLQRAGLEPNCLELELSESMLTTDIDEILPSLNEFRRLGVHLAMDDFGAGQSTLAHLTRWPLSSLKLDRSLLADAVAHERGRAVVESVMHLAAALDVVVVAQGIETSEQLALLAALHCARGQGFLLAPPQSAQACEDLLRAGPARAGFSAFSAAAEQ